MRENLNDKMLEEGDECPDTQCPGVGVFPPVENCLCHISPPCSACTSNEVVCSCCGMTGQELAAEDPGKNTMIGRDENANKSREFDQIIRRREYERRKKELLDVISDRSEFDAFWDGQHLAGAIEKTADTARHPHTMWPRP